MVRICSTHREDKCTENFSRKTWREQTTWRPRCRWEGNFKQRNTVWEYRTDEIGSGYESMAGSI